MTVTGEAYRKLIKRPVKKYNSPIVFAQKTELDGNGTVKTRLIIDFTRLNAVKVKRCSSIDKAFS